MTDTTMAARLEALTPVGRQKVSEYMDELVAERPDPRWVSNLATGEATLLYHHLNPRAREYRTLLDGQERPVHTDEVALRHAQNFVSLAEDLVAELERRVSASEA